MGDKKYNNGFKNSVLIFILILVMHSVTAVILKQAVKLAVFSEMIGIMISLAVVFGIMMLIYFIGRKVIIRKNLISVKSYYILSAFIPSVVWFIIAVLKFISAVNAVDMQDFLENADILYILELFRTVNSALNSLISSLSSAMVFIVASLFEILNFIVNKLKKKVKKE